jgi:hypothetical protein
MLTALCFMRCKNKKNIRELRVEKRNKKYKKIYEKTTKHLHNIN